MESVLLLPLAARPVLPEGLTIDHKPVGCVAAGQFPVLAAHLDPVDAVGRARVYFRASGGAHWYFVEMKEQGGAFSGTLPKPKAATKQIEYYVEAVGKGYGGTRTAEYSPAVVALGACGKGVLMAAFATSAKVTVGALTGTTVVPVGFSAAGVVQAAGTAERGRLSRGVVRRIRTSSGKLLGSTERSGACHRSTATCCGSTDLRSASRRSLPPRRACSRVVSSAPGDPWAGGDAPWEKRHAERRTHGPKTQTDEELRGEAWFLHPRGLGMTGQEELRRGGMLLGRSR